MRLPIDTVAVRFVTAGPADMVLDFDDYELGEVNDDVRRSNSQVAVMRGNADSARRTLLRPGTLTGHRTLAMGEEERVQQGLHRGPFVGIEQLRRFKGKFQAQVITQTAGAEDQLVTGRRKRRGQLTKYAERGFGLARFIEADLVREHVEAPREERSSVWQRGTWRRLDSQ